MLRAALPVAVMTACLAAALPTVVVPRLWVSRMRGIAKLTECIAEGLDLLLVGVLLDLDVVEHFRNVLHVTQHVIELLDNGEDFL